MPSRFPQSHPSLHNSCNSSLIYICFQSIQETNYNIIIQLNFQIVLSRAILAYSTMPNALTIEEVE